MSGRVNSGRLKENLRSLYKRFGVYERGRLRGITIYIGVWPIGESSTTDKEKAIFTALSWMAFKTAT